MKTLDLLEREHRWIGHMADALEAFVARAKAEDRLPRATYELLCLYEAFADGRHQDKEEHALFPALLELADRDDEEALGHLVMDHHAERRAMEDMRINLLGAVNGEPGSVRAFVRAGGDYLSLHRAHLAREEAGLLPMVERLLTPAEDARVARVFETIEGGPGDPHGVEEQVRAILRAGGLPAPPAA